MIATVDYGDGVPREAIIGISTERVKPGAIVIVHAGVIVSEMSEEEIVEQIEFFKQVLSDELETLSYFYRRREALLELSRRVKGERSV
jgi:hydrogenase maturation factor